MTLLPLNGKQSRFCDEFLVDLNATAAAVRAGYSARSAKTIAGNLMTKEHVTARIAELQAARAEATGITAAAVLRRFWLLANADPNEVSQFRRTCCRHCHGVAHEYQRTPAEERRDRATFDAKQIRGSTAVFDTLGGVGYDRRKPPHPDCPECYGEGYGEAFFPDTRNLSESGRLLYAGTKVTKDGVEIRTNDQAAALVNVAKHLGMFGERVENPETADEKAARIRAALEAMDAATVGE